MSLEVICSGGGEVMKDIMNAIAALTAKKGLSNPIMLLSITLGSIGVFLKAQKDGQIGQALRWFSWVIMAAYLLFIPKVTVGIDDPVEGVKYKVDHVPIGLALVASISSRVGYQLTQAMESVFTLPNYLPYHQYGSLFAVKTMAMAKDLKTQDPIFKENMTRFVNRCVVYDAFIGRKYTVKDLKNTGDIWGLVTAHASPVLGLYYKTSAHESDIVTCQEAARKLSLEWESQMRLIKHRYAQRFTNIKDNTRAIQEFDARLLQSYQMLTKMSGEAVDILKQNVMTNALREASLNRQQELGLPLSYATHLALEKQKYHHLTFGAMTAYNLPMIKVIFECLMYAAFIFLLFTGFLPTGISYLFHYISMIVWVQLWGPVWAVLNFIISIAGQATASISLGDASLSWANQLSFSTNLGALAAWAGYLSVFVPYLSYILLKGGASAFMHMAGTLMGASQSAASGVSESLVTGNYQHGSVGYMTQSHHLTSGYHYSDTPVYQSGSFAHTTPHGYQVTTHLDGSHAFLGGPGRSTSVGSERLAMQDHLAATASTQLAAAEALSYTKSQELAQATNEAIQSNIALTQRAVKSLSSGEGFDMQYSSGVHNSFKEQVDYANALQERFDISASQAAQLACHLTAGIKSPLPLIEVGVNAKGELSSQGSRTIQHEDLKKVAQEIGYNETLDSIARSAKDLRFSEQNSEEKALADTLSSSMDRIQNTREALHLNEQRTHNWSQVDTLAKNYGLSGERDLTHNVLTWMVTTGRAHDMEEAYQAMEHNDWNWQEARATYQEGRLDWFKDQMNQGNIKSREEIEGLWNRSAQMMKTSYRLPGEEVATKAKEAGLGQGSLINHLAKEQVIVTMAEQQHQLEQKKAHISEQKDDYTGMLNHKLQDNIVTRAWRGAKESLSTDREENMEKEENQ